MLKVKIAVDVLLGLMIANYAEGNSTAMIVFCFFLWVTLLLEHIYMLHNCKAHSYQVRELSSEEFMEMMNAIRGRMEQGEQKEQGNDD